VEHRAAERPLFGAEMTHAGEEVSQPQGVLPNVVRLVPHLHHHDGVTIAIETVECRRLAVELVAQHDDQMAKRHALPFSASPISSSTLGSSMVAGMVQDSPSAIFLMVPRRILPERVFGKRPTVMARLKEATGPSFSRT